MSRSPHSHSESFGMSPAMLLQSLQFGGVSLQDLPCSSGAEAALQDQVGDFLGVFMFLRGCCCAIREQPALADEAF